MGLVEPVLLQSCCAILVFPCRSAAGWSAVEPADVSGKSRDGAVGATVCRQMGAWGGSGIAGEKERWEGSEVPWQSCEIKESLLLIF